MVEAFIHGILLAFGLILPLGVQNVFIFNQGAIQPQFNRALPAALTAAICDTLLILLAVEGVSLIIFQWLWLKQILYGVGVVFMLFIGYSLWKSAGAQTTVQDRVKTALTGRKQILFAASVSIFNPHAILDTIGVIGTNSLQYEGETKWAFTLAAIGISWLWFFGLAAAGRMLRTADTSGKWIAIFNRISAITIWGIACYMLITLLRDLTA
ncbi:LysE/ArgO family amino acid transporter [Paenibacillus sp. SC116]|uniref:LysE/ArgO family amino acid transporter n=1 Tax=Paenibacillus sp. SC116 TaxID=2968986 RepID=UPI00215A14B3|nr:LysE/ArgO family amino acid transporter [Paenibacillus sp. SC116]MCR8844622.1 LysE/ArgO family amino acid transporter [Paenibacillus sp. SC116]